VRGRGVRKHAYVRADAGAHPRGRISLSAQMRFFTVGADGKNPSARKNADACGRLDETDVRTVNFTVGLPFRHPYVGPTVSA
jgi:hypothetical protein